VTQDHIPLQSPLCATSDNFSDFIRLLYCLPFSMQLKRRQKTAREGNEMKANATILPPEPLPLIQAALFWSEE